MGWGGGGGGEREELLYEKVGHARRKNLNPKGARASGPDWRGQ